MTDKERERIAAAALAWTTGLAAQRNGDRRQARLWLERATRLAPNDPRITLSLANLRVTFGVAEEFAAAAVDFAHIAKTYDDATGWFGLMTARRLAGDHRGAAEALGTMLARHCLPDEPNFAVIAALVAQAAGMPGWCGLSATGILKINVPGVQRPTIFVDGKTMELPTLAEGFAAPAGRQLAIAINGDALLGSPLDLAALRRVEGVVEYAPDGLQGWVSMPACPETAPALHLIDAKDIRLALKAGRNVAPDADAPLLRRHGFSLPVAALQRLTPPFRLRGPDEANIFGSPIDPASMRFRPAADALSRGAPVRRLPPRRPLAVVMPVYRSFDFTRDCLGALFAAAPAASRIIVVDDATPEPELAEWLDELAAAGRIELIRHASNRGFPAAANAGIQAAHGCDILLLNSDTLVPPGAIDTLLELAYADAATGSVTPLSNEATILNYPDPNGSNPAPDLAGATTLNTLARQANGADSVEIPTGVGFCMLMRHDCIAAAGLFRGEIFAQGYGEENDWCLRASRFGYSHAAATGAYVAHLGGVSFGAAGRALKARNARLLNGLYPGYDTMIRDYIAADPLAPARQRLDTLRFKTGRKKAGAVLFISHNHGGGVARQVTLEMAALRAHGQRPILLFPAAPTDPEAPFPWETQLTDDKQGDYPNLRFTMPAGWNSLLRLLKAERVSRVVLHHALGHHPAVRGLAAALGVPQDIVIHDYASFCPRVNLLTRPEPEARLRYCGEPNVAGCIACVSVNGDETFEGLGVVRNLARSASEFSVAHRITAPSSDAARRIARHFPGVQVEVTPWEDDALQVQLKPPGQGRRKVAVIGGIGAAKGYDLLIDCAEDAAARDLPLDFLVAGASAEDKKLLETGRIFVTGAYEEGEATRLIRMLEADLAFLPSIWPETWCFALSEAWQAGLYAIAFDLGAQAARIRATGRGAVLPLGLPPPRINDMLLAWRPNLHNSEATNKIVL